MANDEQFVRERMALLDPPAEWQPDAATALGRFRGRAEMRRPNWVRWVMAAAALVVVAICLLPAGRGWAQQVWQWMTVQRVGFIQVHAWPAGVRSPQVGIIGTPLPPIPARDVNEAQARVQYVPRLPRAGLLAGNPQLYTTFGVSAGTVVKLADLELALRKAGVTDQSVPQAWDGAQIALHTSGVVIAQWPEVALAQSLPLTLTAPAGFDFPAYSALVLRVLGISADQAQRLAQQMGTTPPWLAPLVQDLTARGTLEEVTLRSGPATVLHETNTTTVVWSVADRVYVLRGTIDRALAIAAADAVQ
ncbi:MAG TPA: hypothetical protein VKT81_18610 [Bryobacteraceae bacterium]|nr:hypothetical protein [Bryobacteraceae bacterium]